jgi:hypothetical protein
MTKCTRYCSPAVLSLVAFFAMCSMQSQAAEITDVMHVTDDYPACSFSAIDAETGSPVKNVFALAEWYKDVSVAEYATTSCRKDHRVRSDGEAFSIPAARCSGFRHGTTLEVRVKASGYRVKNFRLLRRPTSSNLFPHIAYLRIQDCGKALEQYQDRNKRRRIETVFGDAEVYHEQMISELRSFSPDLTVDEAKKSYCEIVLKDIPQNKNRAKLIEWTEPYCKDPKSD